MKAWKAKVKDAFCSTVVFAETRGKAKTIAQSTDCCEYTNFIDIEVKRFPEADKMYRGKHEMNWENPNDRLFLVKECEWTCECPEFEDCKKCIAKDYCTEYKYIAEEYESEVSE